MPDKGTISVNTEDIFPVIKKFLYSDQDIFLRELISNAVDATQKLEKLASMGEFKEEVSNKKIKVSINEKNKTITVADSGVGMTAEEIKKYINQIAFSGATEFVEKFKDIDNKQDIIGKFGLGFYSAFMVADKVDIITLSYQEGAQAVQWTCTGNTEFEITKTVKKTRGTEVVLHVSEDAKEYLEKSKIQAILDKYGKFLPIEITFDKKVINNTTPIWVKNPSDLKDEDYLNFYKELYPFSENPLFWIHLNVDYPFNLTGILYFPKVKNDITLHKDKIQLYSRQVFITDEVKDIVPEFLTLLHGVIDSPEIPLNVSRSYLQSDSNVKKINSYITRKVADKLGDLFKNDRKSFEEKWESIGLFVKYGMISEEKFYDKAKKFVLVENIDNKYFTLDEYSEHTKANQVDKDGNTIWLYTNNEGTQYTYIQSALKQGYDVMKFDKLIDNHFTATLEGKLEKTQVKRVDSDVVNKLIDKDEKKEMILSDKDQKKVKEVFKKVIGNETIQVEVAALAADELPVSITLPEFMRRMQEMAAMNNMAGLNANLPNTYVVTINGNHSLASSITAEENPDKAEELAKQSYDLALLSQNMLQGKDLTVFIERSVKMLNVS